MRLIRYRINCISSLSLETLKTIAERGLMFAIWASVTTATALASDKQPNIIFILLDDVGWADLGIYGSKAVATPNLDKLAQSGMRFTNAYAGHTVCAPSRGALMTGKHTGNSYVRSNQSGPIPEREKTVAEVFKTAGYTTGGFGKWGLGDLGTTGVPERQGFDTFFGYYKQGYAHTYYPSYLIDTGKIYHLPGNAKVNGFEPGVTRVSTVEERNRIYIRDKSESPESGTVPIITKYGDSLEFSHYEIVARTRQFIKDNKDKPFFCYAPWTPPHEAYHLPETEPAWQLYKNKPWSIEAKVHASFITMADRHIGELVTLLEDLALRENTLIFFMSDNGAANRFNGSLDSSGPLRGYKRSMYEGGIRSPLIVSWPGKIKGGQVSNLLTYSADFMPTVAEIIKTEKAVPSDINGLSILPTLLNKQGQKQHDFLYWEWPGGQPGGSWGAFPQAVRHGKWKLSRLSREEPWQLYDLENDLGEVHNIAASHPGVVNLVDHWVKNNRTPRPYLSPTN